MRVFRIRIPICGDAGLPRALDIFRPVVDEEAIFGFGMLPRKDRLEILHMWLAETQEMGGVVRVEDFHIPAFPVSLPILAISVAGADQPDTLPLELEVQAFDRGDRPALECVAEGIACGLDMPPLLDRVPEIPYDDFSLVKSLAVVVTVPLRESLFVDLVRPAEILHDPLPDEQDVANIADEYPQHETTTAS